MSRANNQYKKRRKRATPKWLSDEQYIEINKVYGRAKYLTRKTGINYSVDHIIPLAGDWVCGLHVPWNLQVLTVKENTAKAYKEKQFKIAANREIQLELANRLECLP